MFNLQNLNTTCVQSDMWSYSADATQFRLLCRRFVELGIQVSCHACPMTRQTVVTLWEQGEVLVERGFDQTTGAHNANYWMSQQLKAYKSWS